MLNQLQEAKLDRRFELLDTDGDGFITSADFDMAAARVCEAFGHPEGSPRHEKVHLTYLNLWVRLSRRMDRQGTGRITRDQYLAACRENIVEAEGSYDRLLRPIAQSLLNLADVDDDGRIGREEFVTLYRAFGVCADDAHGVFEELDRDGNGVIDGEEIHQAVREFFIGDDPAAPGNRLFGPLTVALPPPDPFRHHRPGKATA